MRPAPATGRATPARPGRGPSGLRLSRAPPRATVIEPLSSLNTPATSPCYRRKHRAGTNYPPPKSPARIFFGVEYYRSANSFYGPPCENGGSSSTQGAEGREGDRRSRVCTTPRGGRSASRTRTGRLHQYPIPRRTGLPGYPALAALFRVRAPDRCLSGGAHRPPRLEGETRGLRAPGPPQARGRYEMNAPARGFREPITAATGLPRTRTLGSRVNRVSGLIRPWVYALQSRRPMDDVLTTGKDEGWA